MSIKQFFISCILLVGTLALLTACSDISNGLLKAVDSTISGEQTVPTGIVGTVNWQETSSLSSGSAARRNANAVAALVIAGANPNNRFCTGFLVTKDLLITNRHCFRNSDGSANTRRMDNVEAVFNYEQGASSVDRYLCNTQLLASREDDIVILQCERNPGNVWGTVELDVRKVRDNESIYIIHQNCTNNTTTPYVASGCNRFKKISFGTVTDGDTSDVRFSHSADTLPGSSGAPVFSAMSHKLIGFNRCCTDRSTGLANGSGGLNQGVTLPNVSYLSQMDEVVKWFGEYHGFEDGNPATLLIGLSPTRSAPGEVAYSVILSSGGLYRGVGTVRENGPYHILKDLTLKTSDGKTKTLSRLYLHTWNTKYITGYSVWRDQEFGMSFSQAGSLRATGGSRFGDAAQFLGSYDGKVDGKPASLSISSARSGKANVVLNIGALRYEGRVNLPTSGWKHELNVDGQLRTSDGQVASLDKLFMHTWNDNLISGHTTWRGIEFGTYFVRR